jgi:hypothetical protein
MSSRSLVSAVLAALFLSTPVSAQNQPQSGMTMVMPWLPGFVMHMPYGQSWPGVNMQMGPGMGMGMQGMGGNLPGMWMLPGGAMAPMMGWGQMVQPLPLPPSGSMMVPVGEPLSTEQAKRNIEFWLNMSGNSRLRPGMAVERPDNTILAEILSPEGMVVMRYVIDRKSGWFQQAQ